MMDKNRSEIARTASILTMIAISAALALPVFSQSVPTIINYQGRLTDNSPQQNPVSAALPMEFSVYDSLMGGNLEWSESWASVTVANGIFSVLLGSDNNPIPSSLFTGGSDRYLEVIVDGQTLSPRQRIGATGYAHQSERSFDSDSSSDLACSDCVDSSEVGFAYAGASSKGGPATDLECIGCVGTWSIDAAEVQRRVTLQCPTGGIGTINEDGSVSCASEADPQVGTLTDGRWCNSDGASVNCTELPPAETDPQVGTIGANRGCVGSADGSEITCNNPYVARGQCGWPTGTNNCRIPFPHFETWQLNIGGSRGTPGCVATIWGIENDSRIQYTAINDGVVTSALKVENGQNLITLDCGSGDTLEINTEAESGVHELELVLTGASSFTTRWTMVRSP